MFVRFLSPKAALFFLIIFSISIIASSQDTRATLLGVVTDKTGAAITNATVTATAQATGLKWTAATDGEGRYRIPLLPSGSYTLTVEAARFTSQTQMDLILRVGEERRVDVILSAGQIEASVTVTAPLTDSAATTLSAVVPEERVASLPLNGRQLQELALTVPGVSAGGGFRSDAFNQFGLATPTDGNAGAFTVNGAPSRANGFFLDGVDINIPEQGVIAFPPLVESIREFQVQTSLFNAEYGRFSGSIVNVVTKSGANDWHGAVYEYFRNDRLDANNFFNNANGLPRTILKQNQYGVSVGGPLRKNRHFIFGNWEGSRVRQGTGPFASNVPAAEQRAGALRYTSFTDTNGNGRFDAGEPTAPAMLDIANRIAPISRKILDGFIPLPNAVTAGANFIADGIQKMDEDAFTIRADSQLTSRGLFTARYSYDDQRQFFPFDIFFISASLPAFPFPNPERRQSLALSYTQTFSNNLVNEVRFGLNRQRNPIPSGTTIDPASIGLPNGAPQNEFGRGLPIIRVTGFGGTGGQPLTDNLGASTTARNLFQYIDNLSLTHGRHSLKFGGEVRRAHVNSSAYRPLRGSLNFNGSRNGAINPTAPGNAAVAALADFLLGLPAQATINSANPTRGFRTTAFSGYAQDEWRVTNRLTLNLGLRYEIDTPLTEVNGSLSNLIPGAGNFVVGSAELPRLHRIDKNNFAPRAGFAYRLTGDGKTTVRGGAGVFYDNGVFQDRFVTARTNAPFAITAIDNNPAPFPQDDSPAVTFTRLLGSGQATSAASIDVNYRTPYALQYNLNVQRELSSHTLAEIAYVGRRGLNASRPVNINQVVAANSLAATVLGLPVGSRPFDNPNVTAAARFANDIIQQQFNGQSTYHSLQLRVERRFAKGLSFLAGYTWSKSIDDISGIGTGADDRAQDSYNLRAQRAVSNFDITHRFTLSATYDLPFGKGRSFFSQALPVVSALISDWQVNSIMTWQSGLPFTVTVGSFDPVAQISNRRPDVISDPRQNAPAGLSFNPAAFVALPTGQLGNSGRNTLRGDRYYNTDISLIRQFPLRALGDAGSLNFRAEFFNVFNHPNFSLPVSSLSSGAFGRFVNNATAPRIVQFALKATF
ncbi:MAG: TonB-dependent receptor [Acidobacteria bacterium]|nr:TonB-dependent receptor [Acidobacteriota bacterium]